MRAIKRSIHFILFVASITAICHYLYSWIGFNPTDEGFVLAGARRILDGQFPLVDFLTLRPPGSAYLHALVVKYGGEQTFYLSRMIFWIQSAIIAWIWVAVANKLMKLEIILVYKYMLAAIIFIFNVHNFPPMAWTTVDGLFLASIGIFFITHFGNNGNQIGYVLLGCAALCKQNFLVLIPGVFVIMGHFRRPYYILDAFTPIVSFAFFLWKFDALNIAMEQLFSRRELMETGIIQFVKSPSLVAGFLLPLIINAFRKKYKGFLQHIDFILVFDLIVLGAAALIMNVFIGSFSFGLFGFLMGYTIVHIKRKGVVEYNLLTLLLAWTVAISLGYNTPALASGMLLAALLAINYNKEAFSLKRPIKYAISSAVFLFLLFSFHYSRTHFIYKDNAAKELTADLGVAFYGGQHIKTNTLNQEVFFELDSLYTRYQDSLIIAPDYAAFWVTSKYPNPLNIDWPNRGETESEWIQCAIEDHLLANEGRFIMAIQKYRASELYIGKNPLEDSEIAFPIVSIVKNNFIRVGETEFFYLYR
ncbi:MAG: hypothetical protein R2753_17575 [Chitinophagales bacterium]